MPDTSAGDRSARPAWLPATLLLALALIWFATVMWQSHALITGNVADPTIALSSAATALPVLVAASVVAGAAAGLVATGIAGGGRLGGTPGRLAVGALGGAACGLPAAGVIVFAYGSHSSVAVLAATVGAAAVLGGAAAALPQPAILVAVAAAIAVFVFSVVVNAFQSPLMELLGAGDSLASRAGAATRLAYLQSGLCGLVAGTVAFVGLRRTGAQLGWPLYLLGGAGPGLALLLAEAVTRLGGAPLLNFVRNLSPADEAVMAYGDAARVRNAMIIGFVGGILAMVLYGRTLQPAAEEPAVGDEPAAGGESAPGGERALGRDPAPGGEPAAGGEPADEDAVAEAGRDWPSER